MEYLLCDAFAASDVPYWCDGFVADAVELRSGPTALLRGVVWCADHRTQWQVPAEAELRRVPDSRPCLRQVVVRVGDGETGILKPHTWKSRWPDRWLLEFRIEDW